MALIAQEDKRCPLPFIQMMLDHTGKIVPCCFNQELEISAVKGKSLEELWNHPRLKALREEILSGETKSCARQIKMLGCNKGYERFRHLVDWQVEQKKAPIRLDVRLNGQCNLQCVMCGVWEGPNKLYDESFFWKEGPEKIFPQLQSLVLLGGEPFVQKDTYRLIKAIAGSNKDCVWVIYTNGHWKWTEEVQKHLDLIPQLTINVSLDSVKPDVYQELRKGGTLSKTLVNLNYLLGYRALRAGFSLQVSFLLSKKNWQEIPAMLDFCAEKNVIPKFQFLETPAELSLRSLSLPERKEIFSQMQLWSKGVGDLEALNWQECLHL